MDVEAADVRSTVGSNATVNPPLTVEERLPLNCCVKGAPEGSVPLIVSVLVGSMLKTMFCVCANAGKGPTKMIPQTTAQPTN